MVQINGESKIRKILFNEVSFIMGIVAVVLSSFIYITSIGNTNETALRLQEERLAAQRKTIDEITKTQQNDIQEIKAEIRDMKSCISALEISVERLSTIINERIPIKKWPIMTVHSINIQPKGRQWKSSGVLASKECVPERNY